MTEIVQQKYCDSAEWKHFYDLLERHKALIERLCIRRASGNFRRSADLIQECYIFLWRHEKQFSADMSLSHEKARVYWLCRSAFSNVRFLEKAGLWEPLGDNVADFALGEGDESLLRDRIESLATVLTPYEKRAVDMIVDGYTEKEMASILGIKLSSVTQLRYRIICKLRKHYNPTH